MLTKCRQINSDKNLKLEIINTLLIVLLGLALGVLAKCLDNISINDDIPWQHVLGVLDLRNVFSRPSVWALFALGIAVYSRRPARAGLNVFVFFAGMLIGYYAITITMSGFFPKAYMAAWFIITLFTPVPAFLAWYAKGHGWLAAAFSAAIIGFFFTQAFHFGIWYIGISYYAELICLMLAIIILYRDQKQLILSLTGALVIAPFIQNFLPYIFGGL